MAKLSQMWIGSFNTRRRSSVGIETADVIEIGDETTEHLRVLRCDFVDGVVRLTPKGQLIEGDVRRHVVVLGYAAVEVNGLGERQ